MSKEKEFEYEYNPIKEQVGNKAAERVIWTTAVIEKALEGIQQGQPLKASPFLNKNTKLLKPELVRKYTPEEIEDYKRCALDPLYFASKCFLMTPEGLQACKLRDYQEDYIRHLQKNRFSIFLSCRQSGKCNLLVSNQLYVFDKLNIEDNIYNKLVNNILNKYDFYEENNCIYVTMPMFEFYNLYCNQTLAWKIKYYLYKLIYRLEYDRNKRNESIIKLTYIIIQYLDLITSFNKKEKFIENYEIKNVKVKTDNGYSSVSHIHLTKPFKIYKIMTQSFHLECADEHILFDKNFNEIYVKDLSVGDYIQTENGLEKVTSISVENINVCMGDLSLDDQNHRYYSNGILSHNSTTTAIYCLWVILFNSDKAGLILSKSGPAGLDLIKKIKDMYLYLPYHLKIGTMKWNQSEISFDNNSSISTESFSPTAGLGKTINFLILDEFAWCPPNDVELFYNNIIPTVTTITDSNVCIMSTQNGFNLFYKLWKGAIEKKNIYAPFKVDWYQVPQFNTKTKQWEKRTEKWKNEMIGVLGSEEAFYYQYGTQFSASDRCLVSRELLATLRNDAELWVNKTEEIQGMYNLYLQHHEFLFFKPDFNLEELKTGFFIITIDLAEGGGADSTVFNIFQMVDKDILKHIGYWKSDCVDLDHAALEFWLLASQLFNGENCIWSLEWNTYGALFYRMLLDLNENEFDVENGYRFNISPEGLEISNFVMYKKKHSEEDIVNSVVKGRSHSQFVPGIKLTSGNKPTACSLLKIMFEKHQVITTDLITLGELENFEDKNGNGTYKASTGHDDLIMTFVQLPMLMQSSRYKNFVEDYLENQISLNHDSKWSNSIETNPFDYNNSFNELFGPSPIPGSFEIFNR